MGSWRQLLAAPALGIVLALAGCSANRVCPPPPAPPHVEYQPARWSELPGWHADALPEAWPALLASCPELIQRATWRPFCSGLAAAAQGDPAARRAFMESALDPWRIVTRQDRTIHDRGLITGYYEVIAAGSRSPSARFPVPLYGPPADLLTIDLGAIHPELAGLRLRGRIEGRRVVPYYTRAELAAHPPSAPVVAWVADPFTAFLFEVQGSGRIELAEGGLLRVEYADQNGQPYRAVGRRLIELGEIPADQVDMPAIRAWVERHPERVAELLDFNPSVVFFRESRRAPGEGPRGSLGVGLTAGRSVAVDTRAVPQGAPLYLATADPIDPKATLERLVVAQDSGGAIRGAPRADLYWGSGPEAAERAGRMRSPGRMWLLWPRGVVPEPPANPPAGRP